MFFRWYRWNRGLDKLQGGTEIGEPVFYYDDEHRLRRFFAG